MADQDIATEDRISPRRRQLTLRTLMLVVLILALSLGWWVDRGNLKKQIPAQPQPNLEVKIFTLLNGKAQELAGAIRELFPSDPANPLYVASDPITNSIIVRGTEGDLEVVEAILLKIESEKVSDE